MKILAIETSCDDTCVAILKIENCRAKRGASSSPSLLPAKTRKLKIESNVISSQVKLHAKYGGVYPFMAKREHQRNLPIVFKKALKKAKNPKINLIAVTIGPGLEPCLWVGVNFAKELSQSLNLPLVPVNHIEAHIFANLLPQIRSNFQFSIFNFQSILPAICLVVSGGHTQLILMKRFGKYKILGETRDDAAGECFDKAARILGLGYPGGPAIAAEAAKVRSMKYEETKKSSNLQTSDFRLQLPRPMIYQKNYDFSFSGLKTAVLYKVRSMTYEETKKRIFIQTMCNEVQQAIIDVLIHKILRAAKDYKVKTIILGGGVAANKELRKQFKQKIKKEIPNSLFLIPDSKFCTDNAAMIAMTGYFHRLRREAKPWKDIKANANLRIGQND